MSPIDPTTLAAELRAARTAELPAVMTAELPAARTAELPAAMTAELPPRQILATFVTFLAGNNRLECARKQRSPDFPGG